MRTLTFLPFIAILGTSFTQGVRSQSIKESDRIRRDSLVAHHFERAVDLYNEHDDTGEALIEAVDEFNVVLQLHPRHAPSVGYLGLIHLVKGDEHAADSLFSLAVSYDSSCAEARVGRARILRALARWNAGTRELRRAVQLAPSNTLARWELVNVLLHRAESDITKEDYHEAIPHLEVLLDLDPDDRDAHYDLAQSLERLGQRARAVVHYREVLRIGQLPEDLDVWLYTVHEDIGRCLEADGKYGEAIEEYTLFLDAVKQPGFAPEIIREVEARIRLLREKLKK